MYGSLTWQHNLWPNLQSSTFVQWGTNQNTTPGSSQNSDSLVFSLSLAYVVSQTMNAYAQYSWTRQSNIGLAGIHPDAAHQPHRHRRPQDILSIRSRTPAMYERYYNFTGSPFQLTPDSRFFYGSRGHSRAIAHLTFGLAQGEGFIIVTGEVGAGKTTLIERLVSQLDRDTYAVARINTTQVSGNDLFRLALAGFGVDGLGVEGAEASKSTLLLRFEEALRDRHLAGRHCLLIVDEVQNLTLAALEELRMLSNITENGRASLQTILMGQPQFRRMLASPDLDQLRQRVLASYHLGPLTREETRGLYRAPAVHGRLARQPALGGRRLRRRPSTTPAAFRAGSTGCAGGCCCIGALEQANTITAGDGGRHRRGTGRGPGRDVAGHVSAAANGGQRDAPDLLHRVEALEAQMARRERVFQRLMDVFSNRRAP